MFRWLHKTIVAYAWRYIERHLRKLLDAGDYESVLRHATQLCQKRENHFGAQYWRALALLWLERHREALDIVDRLERLHAEGVIKMPEAWLIGFEEIKCGALSGLKQYEALHDFSSRCLERHPDSVPVASFQLLATMHLDVLTAATPCLHFLDCSIDNFDQAWQFLALYSAQSRLGNEKRAGEIAQLALAKYPDDAGVQEMAKVKCITRDSVSRCVRPRADRNCMRGVRVNVPRGGKTEKRRKG